MIRVEKLHGFNPKKFNDIIKKKEDKIGYTEISLHKFASDRGIQHVRERHIDDIVIAYNCLFLPNSKDFLGNYISDVQLSANFRKYHEDIPKIRTEISDASKCVAYFDREDFRTCIYSLDLVKARQFYNNPSELLADIKSFDKKIIEISHKLNAARRLLSEDDLEKMELTILDVLSEVTKDPDEIWRDFDDHAYLLSFDKQSKELTCFVTIKDGILKTAYFKNFDHKEEEEHRPIYQKPKK